MSQLEIRYDGRSTVADLWDGIRRICREYVDVIGRKQVAFDLDVQGSQLSHALAENGRHYVRAEWLVYLLCNAPDDRLLEALAELRGCDVVARAPMTPEEELAALKDALRETVGPDVQRIVYTRAQRRKR